MTTVVAIDGPAASGKSTTAKLVAQRLGFVHLDTGAMYRAVTLACLEYQLPAQETPQMAELLASLAIQFKSVGGEEQRTILNGQDVTDRIRSPEVTGQVSRYSALAMIREHLADMQRKMGAELNVVCEGRDIGTRVFPGARFKFYLVADQEVRAKRRYDELRSLGRKASLKRIARELQHRDLEDSTREHSPLRRADDALIVDTTNLTIREQVDLIVARVEAGLRSGD
ncbi:MAG: (d)CMP kinase [Fidelibacterota bacterium]|nr:MAG: (d)CMP kinase [Candidatus Neomarinimicrobiota bacterium]